MTNHPDPGPDVWSKAVKARSTAVFVGFARFADGAQVESAPGRGPDVLSFIVAQRRAGAVATGYRPVAA